MRRQPALLIPGLVAMTVLTACAQQEAVAPKVEIFFPHASATLDPPAVALVATAAHEATRHAASLVTVAGFAGANGDHDADVALARRRADVVAGLLREDGVSADRIAVVPRPPSDENPPIAARRVEISVGGS